MAFVFVVIGRGTRWVFISMKLLKKASSAEAFLASVRKAILFKICSILTGSGKEFTDRLFGGSGRQLTVEHEFDQLCQAQNTQANGMVECFNKRRGQVLRSQHFKSAEGLEKMLRRLIWRCNHHLPQKALGHETSVQALKTWGMKVPDLFVKNVRHHLGSD